MEKIEDISLISDSLYKLAEIIDAGYYDNILYYEFHEIVNPDNIYNCYSGLKEFSKRSQDYYKIFLSQYFIDEDPAIIHVAIKLANKWFIVKNSGSNYYLGFGPAGILRIRKSCADKNILGIIKEENIDDWISTNFQNIHNKNEINRKEEEFENLIHFFRHFTEDMQRRPNEYTGINENNIRDKMLSPINAIFEGRANAEAKNRKGKTDILVRTKDGLNEHIFELKVWNGIKTLNGVIEQIRSYLRWQNDKAGIIMFCYKSNFTELLNKTKNFLIKEYNYIHQKNKYSSNEFRFRIKHKDDKNKVIEIHLFLINLKI